MEEWMTAISLNLLALADSADRLKYKRIDLEKVIDSLDSIQRMLYEIERLLNEIDSAEETLNNYNSNKFNRS